MAGNAELGKKTKVERREEMDEGWIEQPRGMGE